MAVRSHVDFFATLTPALVSAVSAEEGRRVSRDETAARLMRELRSVVERWTAYGEWVERVESGAWLKDYQRSREAAAYARPLGLRVTPRRPSSRAKMSASMKAWWATATPEQRAACRRTAAQVM